MKRLIIPAVAALGFACIGQANAAVETYTVDMNGYAIVGFVGSTPEEFAQAQRQANSWEAQRQLDLKPQSMKAVAINQSENTAMTRDELRTAIIAAAQAKVP